MRIQSINISRIENGFLLVVTPEVDDYHPGKSFYSENEKESTFLAFKILTGEEEIDWDIDEVNEDNG